MSQLFLHSHLDTENKLIAVYEKAISEAVELYIFSAYLTHWSVQAKPNSQLKEFKFIFGKDFGLSKKSAIQSVLKWLPAHLKFNFMVTQNIQGFHPKALFWKNQQNEYYALIGSSNLTHAAFNSNFEANILTNISAQDFENMKKWANQIANLSIPVSEDWLEHYQEIEMESKNEVSIINNLFQNLPDYDEEMIAARHRQMANHQTVRTQLKQLISDCANGKVDNKTFYDELNKLWSWKEENNGTGIGNRFQDRNWKRKGKNSNFQKLCLALEKVFHAPSELRDTVVAEQFDWLEQSGDVPARKAVFTEMLCQEYPDKYPVLNEPVEKFLEDNQFKAAKASSIGSRYVDLSLKLRALVAQHHKLNHLAELDVLIQAKYRQKGIDWE